MHTLQILHAFPRRSATCFTSVPVLGLLVTIVVTGAGCHFAVAEDAADQFDAQTNPENPIRRLFGGERLDLWSLRKPAHSEFSPASGSDAITRAGSDAITGAAIVDQLIDQKLSAAGLSRSPDADRRTLIRRLSFNLTGLPPRVRGCCCV